MPRTYLLDVVSKDVDSLTVLHYMDEKLKSFHFQVLLMSHHRMR
jgi:hypothetical protein